MFKRKKLKPSETATNPPGRADPGDRRDRIDRMDRFDRIDRIDKSDKSDLSDLSDSSGDSADSANSADSPFGEVVEIPIEDAIDLHLFSPRDVKAVVLEYLEQASEKGFEEVRIIHGRGIGERRRQVHDLLRGHPLVAEFREAPSPRGGWGATVVWLKPVDRGRPTAR